jgi:hypothetical protein
VKDLSLHILDVAENGIAAGAKRVDITVAETPPELRITIADNGRGMDRDFLNAVTDPFTTTRTTRPVGMGLPLFKLAAEQTGGRFSVQSELGVGTTVEAVFLAEHIDAPPLGDLSGTLFTLIQGSPEIDFVYRHTRGEREAQFDTRAVRAELEDVPLDTPDVLVWIHESIQEAEESL